MLQPSKLKENVQQRITTGNLFFYIHGIYRLKIIIYTINYAIIIIIDDDVKVTISRIFFLELLVNSIHQSQVVIYICIDLSNMIYVTMWSLNVD